MSDLGVLPAMKSGGHHLDGSFWFHASPEVEHLDTLEQFIIGYLITVYVFFAAYGVDCYRKPLSPSSK